jgi:hypothetical protein
MKGCDKPENSFAKQGGITNGAAWYSVSGGMQDFNYLSSNDFEITLELGCDKYPPASQLKQEWEDNKKALMEFMWMAHMGVKGTVTEVESGKAIPNAVIQAKNVTSLGKGQRRNDHIDHDITSVHDGDYWRLLTPGEYEITVSADGYEPSTKLVEVTMNHEDHEVAPILNFQLMKVTPGSQLTELVNERSNPALENDDIIMGKEQLFNHISDGEGDEDLMGSPSDWTSIAEQYGPFQDMLDMQGEEENDVNGIEASHGMPDYAYDYPEMPVHENLEDQYY